MLSENSLIINEYYNEMIAATCFAAGALITGIVHWVLLALAINRVDEILK